MPKVAAAATSPKSTWRKPEYKKIAAGEERDPCSDHKQPDSAESQAGRDGLHAAHQHERNNRDDGAQREQEERRERCDPRGTAQFRGVHI